MNTTYHEPSVKHTPHGGAKLNVGQYKRLKNEFTGVLTGKGVSWGGSLIRPEATGYGVVYFTQQMLNTQGEDFKGNIVVISGSGNVAQYAAEKILHFGGKVLTMSDSSGYIYDSSGISEEKLKFIMYLKNIQRGRISDEREQNERNVQRNRRGR